MGSEVIRCIQSSFPLYTFLRRAPLEGRLSSFRFFLSRTFFPSLGSTQEYWTLYHFLSPREKEDTFRQMSSGEIRTQEKIVGGGCERTEELTRKMESKSIGQGKIGKNKPENGAFIVNKHIAEREKCYF